MYILYTHIYQEYVYKNAIKIFFLVLRIPEHSRLKVKDSISVT